MSSSSKEQEILERQRKLAAQMSGGRTRPRPPPPAAPPPPRPKSKSKTPSVPKPAATAAIDLTESPIDLTDSPARAGGTAGRTSNYSKSRSDSCQYGVAVDLDSAAAAAAATVPAPSKAGLARPRNRSRPKAAQKQSAAAPISTVPATAADALAAARDRLRRKDGDDGGIGGGSATVMAAGSTSKKTVSSSVSSSSAPASASSSSSAFKRAPIRKKLPPGSGTGARSASARSGGAGIGGKNHSANSMASLLQSAGSLLQSKPTGTAHYPKVEQEDFWRSLRDWDFLRQFNEERKGQQRAGSNGAGSEHRGSDRKRPASSDSYGSQSRTPTPPPPVSLADGPTQPLPDTFDSVRQYTALWAPLSLREARAQILSEAASDVPYWNKRGKGPFSVHAAPLKRDVGSTVDYITVQIKPRENLSQAELESISPSFRPNDIILLARDEDVINRASRGALPIDGERRLGVIGHTESSRRTCDGLWVKVSRKLWLDVGRKEMCLLNVGSNVTAIREFNALCRLSSIPLASYVLGKDLVASGATAASGDGGGVVQRTKSKANMMQRMGGSSALGKGFVSYAKAKFNSSQLQAISASATEYGEGGFTLIKGPPGTGKTTTLVALLNSLHIRQFNKYYATISAIAKSDSVNKGQKIQEASANKPRLLVCAPSNAAVDNVILKIMKDGFIDGNGARYNPSIVRVGIGSSDAVSAVSLEAKVDAFLSEARDAAKVDAAINGYRAEMQRIQGDIFKLRKRINVLNSVPYPLQEGWEVRIDENDFDVRGMLFFVNHKDKTTTYEVPPPPEPDEPANSVSSMPEFRAYVGRIVKLIERHNSITSKLEKYKLAQNMVVSGGRGSQATQLRMMLETHVLDETHIVFTTLGTAGNKALESSAKFEVVVVDEAAQSVEPSTLVGLQLGSKHAILVGDPQQLPATIFSISGRTTKFDRSLFQRLEEAGHEVHLLDKQYRMHPEISDFPRRIFYGGELSDGPIVESPDYGMPLKRLIQTKIPAFRPLTVLDLDSSEERGGTSLSNSAEARLAVHLYDCLRRETGGLSSRSRVAVITPYAQQAALLRKLFSQHLGPNFQRFVEVNTVDAFQGREANIVIFSCVRAAGSKGIGFLSDVRRMNVAITRAKFFLFVIARCKSIVVNPYWREFVKHARINRAVVPVPMFGAQQNFPDLKSLQAEGPPPRPIIPVAKRAKADVRGQEDGEIS